MFACPIQSCTRSTLLLSRWVAQECFSTLKMSQVFGNPATAPYFFHQHKKGAAIDRALVSGQEDRAREAAAHLLRHAERPATLAHQVAMVGVGALSAMDKDPVRAGIVIPQFQLAEFRCSEAGML